MTIMADLEEIDRQTEARLREIEEEVRKKPLTSDKFPIDAMEREYQEADSSHFLAGLKSLALSYDHVRIVRGDGNCYYRAFLYALSERILQDKSEGKRIVQWFKKESCEEALRAGYEEMALETFYEVLIEFLEQLLEGKVDAGGLHRELNQENHTSDYCTWYLRVVTATFLKQDPDRFLPFIHHTGLNIFQFCEKEVEPMGKECEQVQVLALAEAVGIQVVINYLDGHELVDDKVTQHKFGPDDSTAKICLLYRPGHYDILYAKS